MRILPMPSHPIDSPDQPETSGNQPPPYSSPPPSLIVPFDHSDQPIPNPPHMLEFFRDLWRFMRARRKWFLLPIILLLLLLGLLLLTAESSAIGAFVYTLF